MFLHSISVHYTATLDSSDDLHWPSLAGVMILVSVGKNAASLHTP